jgi:acylphosphatase
MMWLYSLPALSLLFAVAGNTDPPKKPIARMVYYTGRVQGVGFRATVVDIARDYPVTGWVKNLADGRVQMYVEGSEESVKKFQMAIFAHWKKNIEKEQMEMKEPAGKFKTFSIMR